MKEFKKKNLINKISNNSIFIKICLRPFYILLVINLFLISGCANLKKNEDINICSTTRFPCLTKNEYVLLITNRGRIKLELYGALAPITVGNFIDFVEKGAYDKTSFNRVIKEHIIVDEYNIENLKQVDTMPTISSGKFDQSVDTYAEIVFVGTANVKQAVLTPVIVDGKIVRVTITDPGRGYKVVPTITLTGTNEVEAELSITINSVGAITGVTVLNQGTGYSSTLTSLIVRRFTVLVRSDSTLNNKWALYERNIKN